MRRSVCRVSQGFNFKEGPPESMFADAFSYVLFEMWGVVAALAGGCVCVSIFYFS